MTHKEFDEILKRYQAQQTTEEENRLVERWLKNITERNDVELPVDLVQTKDRLWNKINDLTKSDTKVLRPSGRRSPTFALVAASVVIVLTTVVFLFIDRFTGGDNTSAPDLFVEKNSTTSATVIHLDDGSMVTLEPGSELHYADFTDSKREVYLKGEGFFEIARDVNRPFFVYAGDVVTKVLGTSFRVTSFPGQENVSVKVKTGKVSVTTMLKTRTGKSQIQEMIVTPNQQVVYNRKDDRVMKSLVEEPEVLSEAPAKKMLYEDTPISQVLDDIKQTYGVDIHYDKDVLASCTITGDLTEAGLYESLEIVCHAVKAEYKSVDASIVIEGKGCDVKP